MALMQRLQAKSASAFHAPKQAAMAGLLLDSLRDGEAVIVLTGAAGSGKTAIVDQTLAQFGAADPALLHLVPPFPTPAELQARLQAMLAETDSPQAAPGMAGIVVVLDDAAAAPLPLLRYLSLMQALTNAGRAALQLVLVGEQTLWQRLGEPPLRDLCASVRVRLTMQPFSEAESHDFVAFRLRQLGCWLAPEASADLVAGGAGLPGRILTLVDAAAEQSGVARGDALLAGMGMPPAASLPAAGPTPHSSRVRLGLAGYAAVVAAALVVAAVWWSGPGKPTRRPAVAAMAPVMQPAARPRPPVMSAIQARLELAMLAPPAWLLDAWRPPRAPTAAPAAAPAPRAVTAAPVLVLANATAPKAQVVFTRGDRAGEASAWAAVRRLRQAGVTVADPEPAARPAGRPGIGYFFAADRPAAALLARDLAGALPAGVLPEAAMTQALPMPPEPPPPGAIRVLIGP